MSFEVIEESTNVKLGGHKTSLVRCKCGNEFYIQTRRIHTQKNCIKCSYKYVANLGHVKVAKILEENEKLKKALEDSRGYHQLVLSCYGDNVQTEKYTRQALKEIEEVLK